MQQHMVFLYMLAKGKECKAMPEAAPAVHPDHLHPPGRWDPSNKPSRSVPLAAQRAHVCACILGESHTLRCHHFLCDAAPTWSLLFLYSRWRWCTRCRRATWRRRRSIQTKLWCSLRSWRVSLLECALCLFPTLMRVTLNQFCPARVCSKCWTAAPSCPPSKSSCWSISSCAGWWLDTRPRRYRRYSLCCTRSHQTIV